MLEETRVKTMEEMMVEVILKMIEDDVWRVEEGEMVKMVEYWSCYSEVLYLWFYP